MGKNQKITIWLYYTGYLYVYVNVCGKCLYGGQFTRLCLAVFTLVFLDLLDVYVFYHESPASGPDPRLRLWLRRQLVSSRERATDGGWHRMAGDVAGCGKL